MTDRRINRTLPTVILPALIALLAPVAAQAGAHYQATTTIDTPGGPQRMVVEAWADGDSGRVEFKESKNPFAGTGTYLLTRDGGRTLVLVNPEEKEYGAFSIDALLGSFGAMMQGMGPLLKIEISAPKVETLLDEPGPEIHGLPTRHIKIRSAYQMKVKVFGMGRPSDVVNEEEYWVTDRLLDKSSGMWLKTEKPKTGNADFDRLIAAEMGKFTGVPLKSSTVTTSTTKGKAQVTKTTMEVTALDKFVKAPVSFDIPAGYKQTEMMPQSPMAGR